MQLHFYSDYAGRLVLGGGASHWWNIDIYPRESIKEFEDVSRNWTHLLKELLKRGAELINLRLDEIFLVMMTLDSALTHILSFFLFSFPQRRMNRRFS